MKRTIAALAICVLAAGCQTRDIEEMSFAQAAPALEFPNLSCAPHGRPNGTAVEPTAERMRADHRAYIEFRQRLSPAIPSGHLYVVFGRLDEQGNPLTRQYIGLYPQGYLLGLYGGAVVPVPATLEPNYADCRFPVQASYRVSLSEGQYRRLRTKVRRELANPPNWHMAAFNCNHFAASLGEVVGLRAPENRLLPAFAYIHALIEANEGRRGNGA